MKTMIVDSEAQNGALLRSVAIPLGYTVRSYNYDEGARTAEQEHFDVIFVGVDSDSSEGVDLVGRIRKSGPNRSAVIVMQSTTEDIPTLRKAIGEGADLFLIKPVSGERLGRMLVAFPEWKDKRHAARLPLVTEVMATCDGQEYPATSLNISESGMLLRSQEVGSLSVGERVRLDFGIRETHSSLSLVARIVRKEATDRAGVAFEDLTPEDINAIHVYVTGRMKDFSRPSADYLDVSRRNRLIRS